MNVLVTGGMGVIGSFVTRLLIETGHRPLVYDIAFRDTLLRDIAPGAYQYVQGDVLDLAHIIHTVKDHKVQRIIHLTSLLDDSQGNPLKALKINVQGTVHILEAARILEVERVVYASSMRAMGAIAGEYAYPTYKPVTEDYPPRPTLMYDITKFASEHIGFNYGLNYGLSFVALRFAQVYGPGKAGIGAVRSKIIENAMLGKPVNIPKGGDGKDDCIYVKDVAQGVVKACFAQNMKHHLFHLGTGKGVSFQDFANAIKKLYPKAEIEIGPGKDYRDDVGYSFDCIFDISRARQELGFEPRYDVESGVADYVAMMQAQGIQPTYIP